MKYSQRQSELNALFKLGVDTTLDKSGIQIRFFRFSSAITSESNEKEILYPTDRKIAENLTFDYPVFVPHGVKKPRNAILLLHGLNERLWNKYLCWAEYLCENTGKPVILFPIAFHMNRSPRHWSDPRVLKPAIDFRREQYGNDRSLSFANVTLSHRMCENPVRFYSSGRQSLIDLTMLVSEIKQGKHPLFRENAEVDIFSYSIGSFLSQITLMTNPLELFSYSKLFMFCGGGIFNSMSGESRNIMDRPAFLRLLNYYQSDFESDAKSNFIKDKIFDSFSSMITPENKEQERVSFFQKLGNRLCGISLVQDTVIPYTGVIEALGINCATNRISLLDFSYPYTHENPFPMADNKKLTEVDQAFELIFSHAANFLA